MLTGPRALLGLSCVVVLAASCALEPRGGEGTKSTPAEKPEVRTVHAPVDIGNVRRDPALAFRNVGGSILSSSATFDATVTKSGALVVTPKGTDAHVVAPLELETTSIVRGTHVLTTRTSARVENGAVAIARGEVEEKIDNDDAALEQSWSFRDQPHGEGDLVVRVRASGESFVGRTAHGLHFADKDLGLRYGTGTWIDADGKRTEIVPSFENGEIVLRVPNDVVTISRYPAVLDPTVTPEKEVDKPAAPGAALGDRTYPLVASSRPAQGGYVAAWYDRRGIRPALYSSRTRSNGTPVADVGNVVANGVTPSTTPFLAAANNGGGYLLVWSVASYDPFLAPGVYAVRLDEEGAPLDQAPVAVADNQGYIYALGAAFDGTNWLVAWQRYNSSTYYDIGGARLSKDGQRLDAKPIDIAKSSDYEYNPVVVSNGNGGFFVGWRANSGGLQGRIVGADGNVTAPTVSVHPSTLVSDFRLAAGNNQYAFAWTESGNVYAKRVDAAGNVLDGGAIPINVDASFSESRPRIVWDGTSYVVAFYRSTSPTPSMMAHRLSPTGQVVDPAPYTIATSSYLTDAALASDGAGSVLVNREYYSAANVPYRYEIRAWSTNKPNAVAGEIPQTSGPNLLSKGAPSETEPSVVWNGTRHQVVWLDQRDTAMTIYGATLDKDGVASGAKVLLANPGTGGATYSQLSRPRVAANGANGFLVVFFAQEQSGATFRRGVFGLVLDGNGNVTGGVRDISVTPTNAPIVVYERDPDIAFDGTNYFVVWQQETSDGYSIAGRRVDPSGNVVDTKESLRLTAVSSSQLRTTPSVAFDGSTYFVAWVTSRQTTSINVTHIYGTRVNKDDLSPLDGELAICEKFLLQRSPHVAADPKGGFFVVWEDNRNSLETADIYGTRITPQGAIADGADGIKVATGAHDEARPRAVLSGDGTNWVVAWRDLRSKQTYDIYGAWVSRNGKLHDPEGFLLSAEGGDEEAPTLTAPQDSKLVLTYQRLDPAAGSYRLRARAIDGGKPVATACATNDECASRSCVDGVCCESECGGCGVCNATPGKCTPRGAGVESPACKNYKCKEGIACPTECKSDDDCSSSAICDPTTNTCVSRVICIDNHTLRDLTARTTDCSPYSCVGEACRTNCGSVDDCAPGFVCNLESRCVAPPVSSDGGCVTGSSSPGSNLGLVAVGAFLGLAAVRRRRPSR